MTIGVGVLAVDADGDGAVEGELQRVGEQVEHHLLPHLAVEVHRLVQRRAVHDERQPGPIDRRAEEAGQLAGDGAQVDRLEFSLHPAGLDAREVQQGVDQLRQPQPVAVNDVQFVARLLIEPVRPAAQLVDRSEDQRERGPELVADVGEKRRLGPVEFGEFFGALLLGPVAARAAHARGDVRRHQLDEAAVAVVEGTVPVERCHQEAERRGALLQQRHHERLGGRPLPGPRRANSNELSASSTSSDSPRTDFSTGHGESRSRESVSGAAGCPCAIPLAPASRASPSSPNR